MRTGTFVGMCWMAAALAAVTAFAGVTAQPGAGPVLAVVDVPAPVWASGKRLPAGTYELRPVAALPRFSEGQKACGSCLVAFVQDGVVRGEERATILPAAEAEAFSKGTKPPTDGARVDLLAKGSYVRIWINRQGTDYIISLPVAP
jgi:hypothetical protein